jgi:hypothetical protein
VPPARSGGSILAEVIFTSSFAFGLCAFAAGAEINEVSAIATDTIADRQNR